MATKKTKKDEPKFYDTNVSGKKLKQCHYCGKWVGRKFKKCPNCEGDVASSINCLTIKLGACLTADTKFQLAELDRIAADLARVRNAAQRHCKEWHITHADDLITEDKDVEWWPDSLAKQLRDIGSEMCPDVYAKLTNFAANQDLKALLVGRIPFARRAQLQWKKPKHVHLFPDAEHLKQKWQAILAREFQENLFLEPTIHVPCQDLKLWYGRLSKKREDEWGVVYPLKQKRIGSLLKYGTSGAFVLFPLYAKGKKQPVFRLEIRQLSRADRILFRQMISGEFRIGDCKLSKGRGRGGKREWFLNISYERQRPVLSTGKAALLHMLPHTAGRPFLIETEGAPQWELGETHVYVRQSDKLDSKRRERRFRYSYSSSSQKGHGQKHYMEEVIRDTFAFPPMQKRFQGRIIRQIVDYCSENGCKEVEYLEPNKRLRDFSWFKRANVNFDWTAFCQRLQNVLWGEGIRLTDHRVDKDEWKEALGIEEDIAPVARETRVKKASLEHGLDYHAHEDKGRIKRRKK